VRRYFWVAFAGWLAFAVVFWSAVWVVSLLLIKGVSDVCT